MRTHKITIQCNSVACAKWYKEEVVDIDFCDLTHWHCGLDGAGEDTPEICLTYLGIEHPENITIELDINSYSSLSNEQAIDQLKAQYFPHDIGNESNGYKILDVSISELDAYKKLNDLKKSILNIWVNKHGK